MGQRLETYLGYTIRGYIKGYIMKESAFRLFCNEKWYQHKDEILSWTGGSVEYDAKYYLTKHRWLLRKMYKESLVS